MGPQSKGAVRIGLGVVVSVACLWLAVRQVPLADLMGILGHVNYAWIAALVLGTTLSLVPRAYRWRVLLGGRGSLAEYFWAQAIGALLTNVFPLRAGEAGRVMVIGRRVGLPLVHVSTSLLLERTADMTVVLGLLAALLLSMDVPRPIAVTGFLLALALGVMLVGVAMLTIFGRPLTPRVRMLAVRLPGRLGTVAFDAWIHGLAALEPLRDVRVLMQIAVWSAVIWITVLAMFWATIEAVVPGARLIEASFAMTAISLGISLPSSPGFIGVFHFVGQQALVTPFPERFSPTSALAVALLIHIASYLVTTALGVIGLARLGLSMRAVRAAGVISGAPAA